MSHSELDIVHSNSGPANVDSGILASMTADDRLQEAIGSRQYVNGSSDQLNPGVNLSGLGDPNVPASVAPYLNTAAPGQTGVTNPSATVQVPRSEFENLRNVALNAQQAALDNANARIEAEEAAFQARIAYLPEHEKKVAVLERELGQFSQVNGYLNEQLGTVEQRRQESAKAQWAFLMERNTGLPVNDPQVRGLLMSAQNPQDMAAKARGIAQLIVNNRQANNVQQLHNGTFAAGGVNGASAAANGPKRHSGDLDGLINSRGYTAVNWG